MHIQVSGRSFRLAIVAVSILLAVAFAEAQDRTAAKDGAAPKIDAPGASYYLCLFSYETTPRRPQVAHSFAVFVKVEQQSLDVRTISWVPQNNTIRLLRRTGDPGMNLDLQHTLENARSLHARIFSTGAYQIKQELYDKAMQQIGKLACGQVLYKVLDFNDRPDRAVNCIHAISDIDTARGLLLVGTNYGRDASAMILEHLSPWIINRDKEHPWIIEKLGLAGSIAESK